MCVLDAKLKRWESDIADLSQILGLHLMLPDAIAVHKAEIAVIIRSLLLRSVLCCIVSMMENITLLALLFSILYDVVILSMVAVLANGGVPAVAAC